jgi:hypothetical protein
MVTRVRCRGVNFTPINAAKRETTVETQEQYNEVTFFFLMHMHTQKKFNFTTHLISKYMHLLFFFYAHKKKSTLPHILFLNIQYLGHR